MSEGGKVCEGEGGKVWAAPSGSFLAGGTLTAAELTSPSALCITYSTLRLLHAQVHGCIHILRSTSRDIVKQIALLRGKSQAAAGRPQRGVAGQCRQWGHHWARMAMRADELQHAGGMLNSKRRQTMDTSAGASLQPGGGRLLGCADAQRGRLEGPAPPACHAVQSG